MRFPVSAARAAPLVAKELRQFFRDPILLTLVGWLYTVEVVICAVALTFDLHDVSIGVVDWDRSKPSTELIEQFSVSPSFAVQYLPNSTVAAQSLLEGGQAQLVVTIPPGYGAESFAGRQTPIQILADGSNAMTAMTALGDAARLVAAHSLRAARADGSGVASFGVENRVRVWYNPDLRFVYFVVISMIVIGAFMVGVIHPAASIVKEKESGTIEHLMVTPANAFELIAAKSVPTLLVGLLALAPALAVARVFDVPFRGSLLSFTILSAAFLLSAIAIGVAIGAMMRTLQQALLVAFFVLFPVMFLSGTMTPIESMPPILQIGSRLSPLRYYMESMLGVMLKGVGLDVLWPQLLWIVGLAIPLLVLATILLRRRLVQP